MVDIDTNFKLHKLKVLKFPLLFKSQINQLIGAALTFFAIFFSATPNFGLFGLALVILGVAKFR